MPEPLLIRCPHCNHALSLPEEFLGQIVSCLECRSPFRAPVREGDKLTAAEKLPRPVRIPVRLFVPTFGLLLLGFAGLFVNLYLAWWFQADPKAAGQFAEANMFFMLETDPPAEKPKDGQKLTDDEEKKRREDQAERQQQLVKEAAGKVSPEGMKRVRLAFAAVSLGVLVGGFCFALRKGYYFCYFACLLAALNSPDIGCCFIGVVIGVWGFMVLISDEGQQYFRRAK
ncbi:hypothetical protein [Limnoglobus roseus]|uniref:Uncharacterized protein n=1 Tax=Limnoglobus roseus TaxID=2598579 RepID=A0A5C1AEW9_9BACT|nr:hypothetical protein [Limnoglobus roseus]QEL17330.1 hypothetical protein PX52LOC_04313 [Limnoglobus roseus]